MAEAIATAASSDKIFVRTSTFKTTPAEKIGQLAANLFDVDAMAAAESKTFVFPDWQGVGDHGVLFSVNNHKVTYVRALNQSTNVITCFITVAMNVTTNGWFINGGGNFHNLSETPGGGLLEDWVLGRLDVNCGYAGKLETYRKDFNPDWYDLVKQVGYVVDAATWARCMGG